MNIGSDLAAKQRQRAAFMPDLTRAYFYKEAGELFLLPTKELIGAWRNVVLPWAIATAAVLENYLFEL